MQPYLYDSRVRDRMKALTELRDAIVPQAVQDLQSGMSIRAIAEKHGVSKTTLHAWLLADIGDDYKSIQRRGLVQRVIDADQTMEDANDPIAVSKARELMKAARWDLERLDPRFNPKTEVSATIKQETPDLSEVARKLAFIMRQGSTVDAQVICTQQETVSATDAPDAETHSEPEPANQGKDGNRI